MSPKAKPPSDNIPGEDSSVLRELKETIRSQAAEIQTLREKLKGGKSIHGSGHDGHGSHGKELEADDMHSYMRSPFYKIALQRVGWLSLFLLSLSLTAVIMNSFDETLARQIELAYFVPLLIGHAGNTGGQSVGTVLTIMSGGVVGIRDAPVVISKEALSGLSVGVTLASVVGPVIYYIMGISLHVSAVIFFTLPLVSTIAATLGSAIPFICIIFGFDPSVIAAPAMTSFVDVTGLMSYFLIARQVFAYFGLEL